MITYRTQTIPVVSILPNWTRNFAAIEDHGGKSIEALSTAEQRLGTLPRGLWSWNFSTLTLSVQETGYIRKVLETPAAIPFAVPFWPHRLKLTVAPTIGNAFVDCEATAGTLFNVLPFAMLWNDFDNFETFNTFTMGTTGVQFAEAITKQFAVGDWIVPLAVGYIKRPNPDAITDINGEFKVEFRETFLSEATYLSEVMTGTPQYEQRAIVEGGVGGPIL